MHTLLIILLNLPLECSIRTLPFPKEEYTIILLKNVTVNRFELQSRAALLHSLRG